MRTRRIVIVGGGFAGLACATRLRSLDAEVILLNRTNHHLFQPLLYQVATAGLGGSDIAQPIRAILRGQRNLHVHMANVEAFDLKRRTVRIDASSREIQYDYLVIALGCVSNYYGNDSWAQHAIGLKSLADAYAIRQRLLSSFEHAENVSDDPILRRKFLTTVVVGGGPTGVEMAGACIELARHAMRVDFKLANLGSATVYLVDAGDRLLSSFPEELSARARRDLEDMGVRVLLGKRVEALGDGFLVVGGERIETATIVWAAGVTPPPIVRDLARQGVELRPSGHIVVDARGRVPGFDGVFAVGDVASCVDAAGVLVPGLAQGAMQLGRHVADEIIADVRGNAASVKPFVYRDKGAMATIGRSRAVAQIGRWKSTGFIAWSMWLAIHLVFLINLRSKLIVLLKWIAAYIFYKPTGRVIDALPAEHRP